MTVVLRQVQVEQYQIGPWRALMSTALVQVVETFLSIACDTQGVPNLVVFEGFPSHDDISGIIFDEQHVDSAAIRCHRWAPSDAPMGVSSLAAGIGKVNQIRVPLLLLVSIPMLPP